MFKWYSFGSVSLSQMDTSSQKHARVPFPNLVRRYSSMYDCEVLTNTTIHMEESPICSALKTPSQCSIGDKYGIGMIVHRSWGLRGGEFCPFSPFFANFSNFTKIPQVPSFQARTSVETPLSSLKNAKFRHGTAGLSNVE